MRTQCPESATSAVHTLASGPPARLATPTSSSPRPVSFHESRLTNALRAVSRPVARLERALASDVVSNTCLRPSRAPAWERRADAVPLRIENQSRRAARTAARISGSRGRCSVRWRSSIAWVALGSGGVQLLPGDVLAARSASSFSTSRTGSRSDLSCSRLRRKLATSSKRSPEGRRISARARGRASRALLRIPPPQGTRCTPAADPAWCWCPRVIAGGRMELVHRGSWRVRSPRVHRTPLRSP